MLGNDNAPMNKWVYFQNRSDSNIRYYAHCKQAFDAKIKVYIIDAEYGYDSPDCVRDEFVYITQTAAQQALNIFTGWEDREV